MTRPTPPSKKLTDMTTPELQKLKLISEINSLKRKIWLDPALWTFLIAVIAAGLTYYSGIFETKSEIVKLQTLQLEVKRDSLTHQIKELTDDNVRLILENKAKEDTLKEIFRQIHEVNKIAKPILDEYNKTHHK